MAELRKVRKEELEEMHQFEKEFAGNKESFEEFEGRFRKYPDLFVVHMENGKMVGEASAYEEDGKVILKSIAVRGDRWGEGIGSKVLKFLEENASKYSNIVSVASAKNVEGFYRKMGYKPDKILVQAKKSELPEDYYERSDLVDERDINSDTKFLYFSFDEYTPELRNQLEEEMNAFESNTVLEKDIG